MEFNIVLIFANRTVWYELLCGEWPFKAQPPEAIIWQVGKGMKQPLANLQASRDVKVRSLINFYCDVFLIYFLIIGYSNVVLVV